MPAITSRRIATFMAVAAAGVLTLAGCGGGSEETSSSPESGEVNIIGYAGIWQEQYQTAVIDPFLEKYPDITINYSSKRSSAEMLSAIQAEGGNPITDVAIMDSSVSDSGNQQGLFAEVSEADVPNIAKVRDEFLNADGYGPLVGLDAVGLLYDTETIPEPPTSWEILWDDTYAGKVQVVAPPSALGIDLTAITSEMLGEDYTKSIDKSIARLAELAPNIQSFAPNPDEYQSIITGQSVLGLGQNARGQYYSDESDGKLGIAFPEEGTVYQMNAINLSAEAPNPEPAKTFMDYALSDEAQVAFAEALYYAPSTDVELPAEVADRVVKTDGSLKVLQLDPAWLGTVSGEWTDRWKREVIGG
ncbi:extracellular solute-binding protein [Microbacterium halophytorum]|uniref:extracellular solute-binding protein n=1 Tax=Microbacterium halophytorum TaxID=2067568 RepID=UPI00131A197A|nr:extracellular solute-binding protein [Microbacterium halophytorum]